MEEKNRQTRQFKQKQREVYTESLTEVKLNQQIQYVYNEMIKDPDINYVRVRFDRAAMPFVTEALSHLAAEVMPCAEENEYIIMRTEESL